MRALLLGLSLLVALPVAAQTPTPDDRHLVLVNAVDAVIRPAFEAFYESAMELKAGMAQLCFERSDGALENARDRFRDQVLAWSGIEFWRMGPLRDDNRSDRIFFWPDRKGIALKQIQAVLAERDESAADQTTLWDKSVALQGLGALEFVLFGTGNEELLTEAGDFRCRFGHAIAENLELIGRELAEAWYAPDGIASHLSSPTRDNDNFRTETEALEGIVGAMSQGIEVIRDTRLLPFLGADGDKPAPRAAAFWRSGMTVPAIAANFAAVAEMFDKTRVTEALTQTDRWIARSIAFEFTNAERATANVSLPVAEALEDEFQHEALKYMVILTQSLQTLIGENLSGALGLTVGFSALDGD